MLKKRMLLLVAALAAFGAIMASAAVANVTGSAVTSSSASVSPQPLVNLSAVLANEDSQIPANGNTYKVADVFAGENDPDYAIEATGSTLDQTGVTVSGCGATGATPYSLTNPTVPTADLFDGPATAHVADLSLAIDVSATNACSISGAVVTVNFQAIAGPG